MVLIAPILGAAVVLSGFTSALPTRRSESKEASYEQPQYEEPKYDEPKYEEPKYDEPKYEEPKYDEPKYEEPPKYDEPKYDEPKYDEPKYDEPKYDEPKYDEKETTTYEYKTTNTYEEYKTNTYEEYKTTTAYKPHETYGSGKPYWGGSEYQDCVNKCIADFPSESSSNDGGSGGGESNEKQGTYQADETQGSAGSRGTGATHTVIVAPSQGVLRMVPFFTNASVGDTVEFHWGANVHTVTQSSALTPCNKSSGESVFASGTQNKSFVFSQVINNTDPTYYFCGTPTHCSKGMFGIINPETAEPGSPDSFSGRWADMAANSSDLAAFAAYSTNLTSNNEQAAAWGSSLSMKNMPEWAQPLMATNILFNRALLGQNPELLKEDGSVDLSSAKDTPIMIPRDISEALNNAGSSPAPAGGAPSAPVTPPTTPDNAAAAAAASQTPPPTGGASSLAASRVLVGAVVVLATVFAL